MTVQIVGAPKGSGIIPLKKGSLTADGSEQTLLEFTGYGRIFGNVDMSNMVAGDVMIIRQYLKVRSNEPYRMYDDATYSGVQPKSLLYVTPKETSVALKVTLQQTAGPYRRYLNDFMCET